MTAAEVAQQYQGLETEQQFAGVALSLCRETLSSALQQPQLTTEHFERVTTEYLNAFQSFVVDAAAPSARCDLANQAAARVKCETDLLFGGTEPQEDIAKRLQGYLGDVVARDVLKPQSISPLPRALSLTLLDMIDDYRPAPRSRK